MSLEYFARLFHNDVHVQVRVAPFETELSFSNSAIAFSRTKGNHLLLIIELVVLAVERELAV